MKNSRIFFNFKNFHLNQVLLAPGDSVIVNRSMYCDGKEIFEITTNDSQVHWKFGDLFLGFTQEQLKSEQFAKLNESIKIIAKVKNLI